MLEKRLQTFNLLKFCQQGDFFFVLNLLNCRWPLYLFTDITIRPVGLTPLFERAPLSLGCSFRSWPYRGVFTVGVAWQEVTAFSISLSFTSPPWTVVELMFHFNNGLYSCVYAILLQFADFNLPIEWYVLMWTLILAGICISKVKIEWSLFNIALLRNSHLILVCNSKTEVIVINVSSDGSFAKLNVNFL